MLQLPPDPPSAAPVDEPSTVTTAAADGAPRIAADVIKSLVTKPILSVTTRSLSTFTKETLIHSANPTTQRHVCGSPVLLNRHIYPKRIESGVRQSQEQLGVKGLAQAEIPLHTPGI